MGQKSCPRAQTAKGAPCLGTTDIIAAITITGDAVCRSRNVVYVSTPSRFATSCRSSWLALAKVFAA
jgi:hypothetical protein